MFMSLGAQTNPDETLIPLLTNQITSGLSVFIYKVGSTILHCRVKHGAQQILGDTISEMPRCLPLNICVTGICGTPTRGDTLSRVTQIALATDATEGPTCLGQPTSCDVILHLNPQPQS